MQWVANVYFLIFKENQAQLIYRYIVITGLYT